MTILPVAMVWPMTSGLTPSVAAGPSSAATLPVASTPRLWSMLPVRWILLLRFTTLVMTSDPDVARVQPISGFAKSIRFIRVDDISISAGLRGFSRNDGDPRR